MLTEILSGLWIGNLEELTNTQFFHDNKISIIINCTFSHQISPNCLCQQVRIPVSEMNEPSKDFLLLKQNLLKIMQFIHTNIDEKNICILGYNNLTIPLIIISIYLLKFGEINKDIIMDVLRSKNKTFNLDYDISYFL
jgi:hypothetical protein